MKSAPLEFFIESGYCPCGEKLEKTEDGYICPRCNWRVKEVRSK